MIIAPKTGIFSDRSDKLSRGMEPDEISEGLTEGVCSEKNSLALLNGIPLSLCKWS